MDPPAQRLPREARTLWSVHGAGYGAAGLVAALMLAGWVGAPAWLGVLVGLLGVVVEAVVIPPLRWRRWRYEIRDEEVDLMRGAFVVRRTIIPIRRVQHVDTESGPLQDSLGLASVTFHTAAGGVSIPALGKGEAERVRARVADLARTRDDT